MLAKPYLQRLHLLLSLCKICLRLLLCCLCMAGLALTAGLLSFQASCLLLRRSAIAAIGGLHSPMFLYGEDVDWGCRLRDAGWRVAYLPGIAVLHLQGGSGGTRSPRWLDGLATIYSLRNAGRRLSSPAFFSAPLRLGFTLRALAYGFAARLRGQPDLARKAEDMRRFASHLRSLRL